MGPAADALHARPRGGVVLPRLGIDPQKEYHTATGRPVQVVRDGTPITGLFG